jgi:hypothetical protein
MILQNSATYGDVISNGTLNLLGQPASNSPDLTLHRMTARLLTGIALAPTNCGSYKLMRVDKEDAAIELYCTTSTADIEL